jgi:hypothetical protein
MMNNHHSAQSTSTSAEEKITLPLLPYAEPNSIIILYVMQGDSFAYFYKSYDPNQTITSDDMFRIMLRASAEKIFPSKVAKTTTVINVSQSVAVSKVKLILQ